MLKKLLIFLMLPILFCACNKQEVEEINFSSWGSITEVQILDRIISDFEQENPNIKVNFIHIPQNYFQKIHLLFASSTAPDVIFINNLYLPVYAGKLEDLTAYADNTEFFSESIDALSVEGRLLALPRDVSNFVFYYNKNLIKGNVDTNWTFKDFKKIIKNSTQNGVFGVSFEQDIFYAEPYIMTFGYDKGIEFYKNMEGKYAPKTSDVGSSTLAQMFLDGKLALYQSGRWMYPKIKETAKFPFGIVKFPGFVPADASGWAISKESKHKEAALKFVKFISSKESIEYFTKTGLIVPARKDASKLLDNPEEREFLEAIKYSRPHHLSKNYRQERDLANKKLFK